MAAPKAKEEKKEAAAPAEAAVGLAAPGTEGAPAPEKKLADIIRGRMPVAVVALVRFGSMKNDKTGDVAKAFGTTVGKVDDIMKNRNFTYVTSVFKPTQAQKDEGIAWLKRHPEYNLGHVDTLITELENAEVATDAEAQAFLALRTASHGQPATGKDGQPIPAGGGNRRGMKAEPKAGAEKPQAASAEDLLK